MTTLKGEEKIKNRKVAIDFFSNERNLLECIPGIKKIEGKRFTIEAKIGPLRAELSGQVEEYEVRENEVSNLLKVEGPGLTVMIKTRLHITEAELNWEAEYLTDGSLAKALASTIAKQAEEVSRSIISCALSKINQS
ncbi:MAG: SRPBCC domain-containing protein [Metallosphaera sp.]